MATLPLNRGMYPLSAGGEGGEAGRRVDRGWVRVGIKGVGRGWVRGNRGKGWGWIRGDG